MRARLALALVLLAGAPLAAQAQGYYPPPPQRYGPREQGLTLAARLGLGFPTGDLSSDVGAMSDTVSSKVPIWLELDYRFNRVLRAGLFLQLSPSGVKDAVCGQGRSCSGFDTMFGADLQFHMASHTPTDPWFGIGVAYESLRNNGVVFQDNSTNPPTLYTADETWGGAAVVLEGGIDFSVSPVFAIGPYLGLTFGRFGDYSQTGAPSYAIGPEATHGWLEVGVKGTFNL